MPTGQNIERAGSEGWSDEEVVERVKAGDTALYEIVMRRYNQRLYRVARAILHDDNEAEDAMQDAYVQAYQHLSQFEKRAPFSAWLTRIAVHAAIARLRTRNRNSQLDEVEEEGEFSMKMAETSPSPEESASRAELGHLLEDALLELPRQYRAVVMLRDVEEMSTSEAAEVLELSEDNVKIRLHRGRTMLRNWLCERVGANAREAFPFMGVRCDRVVHGVLQKVAELQESCEGAS
jgi:RNA polymerase sigma-70 factor, ECF subfamily